MTNKQEIQELIELLKKQTRNGGTIEISVDTISYYQELLKDSKKALRDYQAMLERVEGKDFEKFLYFTVRNEYNQDIVKMLDGIKISIQKYIRGEE